MPTARAFGNVVLSHLTRLASGYAHVFDSQCGYTAASRGALAIILSGPLFPRYGYPNDLLCRLGAHGARVVDVPVRPVYGPDWHSGIRISAVVFPLLRLLLRGMAARVIRRAWGAPSSARRGPSREGMGTLQGSHECRAGSAELCSARTIAAGYGNPPRVALSRCSKHGSDGINREKRRNREMEGEV